MQPRVGHINFLNCLPLTYSLLQCGYHHGMDLLMAVPAVLNDRLVQHKLDISPVSSVAFARASQQLFLLPEMGIVADGAVQSIILASQVPIEALHGRDIMLTAQSATSHCLLKIIVQKQYHCRPNYYVGRVDPHAPFAHGCPAVLLIGDDALYVHHHREKDKYYYDLGEQWKQLTGQCMVYAVWAADRRFASLYPEMLHEVYSRLRQGLLNGQQQRAAVVAWGDGRTPFDREQLASYLDVIHYAVGRQQLAALRTFYSLAVECGFLAKMPKLTRLAALQATAQAD